MSTILWSLPGWPEVVEPGVLDILVLTLFIPLAIAAPIFVIGMGTHWFKQSKAKSSTDLERA